MHLFLAGNKKEMIKLRDLLNEVLSDPELDRDGCEVKIKDVYGKFEVSRTFKVSYKEDESKQSSENVDIILNWN